MRKVDRLWALLNTLLSFGLRASEIAGLRVGDRILGYGQASVVVRQGKGNKQREQLGHASIKTTTIYTKVTNEDKLRPANVLCKAFRNSQSFVPGSRHL